MRQWVRSARNCDVACLEEFSFASQRCTFACHQTLSIYLIVAQLIRAPYDRHSCQSASFDLHAVPWIRLPISYIRTNRMALWHVCASSTNAVDYLPNSYLCGQRSDLMLAAKRNKHGVLLISFILRTINCECKWILPDARRMSCAAQSISSIARARFHWICAAVAAYDCAVDDCRYLFPLCAACHPNSRLDYCSICA